MLSSFIEIHTPGNEGKETGTHSCDLAQAERPKAVPDTSAGVLGAEEAGELPERRKAEMTKKVSWELGEEVATCKGDIPG